MNLQSVNAAVPEGIPIPSDYKKITLVRHKQLTMLAYETEAFMAKKLGKEPLVLNEVCLFGRLMQDLIGIRNQK